MSLFVAKVERKNDQKGPSIYSPSLIKWLDLALLGCNYLRAICSDEPTAAKSRTVPFPRIRWQHFFSRYGKKKIYQKRDNVSYGRKSCNFFTQESLQKLDGENIKGSLNWETFGLNFFLSISVQFSTSYIFWNFAI